MESPIFVMGAVAGTSSCTNLEFYCRIPPTIGLARCLPRWGNGGGTRWAFQGWRIEWTSVGSSGPWTINGDAKHGQLARKESAFACWWWSSKWTFYTQEYSHWRVKGWSVVSGRALSRNLLESSFSWGEQSSNLTSLSWYLGSEKLLASLRLLRTQCFESW